MSERDMLDRWAEMLPERRTIEDFLDWCEDVSDLSVLPADYGEPVVHSASRRKEPPAQPYDSPTPPTPAGEEAPTKDDLLELAWGVIANAGGGNWKNESPDWQEAAHRWGVLSGYRQPNPGEDKPPAPPEAEDALIDHEFMGSRMLATPMVCIRREPGESPCGHPPSRHRTSPAPPEADGGKAVELRDDLLGLKLETLYHDQRGQQRYWPPEYVAAMGRRIDRLLAVSPSPADEAEGLPGELEAIRIAGTDPQRYSLYTRYPNGQLSKIGERYLKTLEQAESALADARAEIEALRALDSSTSPCGHNACFAFTDDGGKNIVCLKCKSDSASAALADAMLVIEAVEAAGVDIESAMLPLGHTYDGNDQAGEDDSVSDYCWATVSAFGHGDCTRKRAAHGPDPAAIAAFRRLSARRRA